MKDWRLERRELNEHLLAQDWHVFGTLKACMGATHFLMKTLPKVNTEVSVHVLAYNP